MNQRWRLAPQTSPCRSSLGFGVTKSLFVGRSQGKPHVGSGPARPDQFRVDEHCPGKQVRQATSMSVKPVFVELEPYRLSFHQLAQEPGRFRTPRFDRFIRMFRFRRINPQQPDPLSIAEQNRVAVDHSGHGRQVMIGVRRAASCSCWAKRISLPRPDCQRNKQDDQ